MEPLTEQQIRAPWANPRRTHRPAMNHLNGFVKRVAGG
jgi:hypothetical protein